MIPLRYSFLFYRGFIMASTSFTHLINERKDRSHSFEFDGDTYLLPPTLPFDAVLRFAELSKRGADAQVQDMEIVDIFKSVVGEDNFMRLRKHVHFDIEMMIEMLNWVLSIYGTTEATGPKGKVKGK